MIKIRTVWLTSNWACKRVLEIGPSLLKRLRMGRTGPVLNRSVLDINPFSILLRHAITRLHGRKDILNSGGVADYFHMVNASDKILLRPRKGNHART